MIHVWLRGLVNEYVPESVNEQMRERMIGRARKNEEACYWLAS